jgi:hypothetical protein
VGAESPATLAARLAAALVCLLAAGCGAGAAAPGASATLPARGRTAGGAAFRVSVAATVDPGGAPAWCPRVDFQPAGGRPTHGAVGCREVRPHVPTGGFAMFCASADVFVLLLSSPATRAVSIETARGRMVALTAFRGVGAGGRFWLGHYAGRRSPGAVSSVDDAGAHVQHYPPIACIGSTPTNGLLGR